MSELKHFENITDDVLAPNPRGTPPLDIKCGPLLRYWGMNDVSPDIWRGSAMIVTADKTSDYSKPPVLTLNGNVTIKADKINEEHGVTFWRFMIELKLAEQEQKFDYVINGDEEGAKAFYVPSKNESMNIMFYSCNGFSTGVDPKEFKGSLWKDVLKDHEQKQHYHVILGGGDQLYCDTIKLYCPVVNHWSKENNLVKKLSREVDKDAIDQLQLYYLWQYVAWFGHGYWKGPSGDCTIKELPDAFGRIPSINVFDDHDIIDGFGSYPKALMKSAVFSSIGNQAFKYYKLFQQQVGPTDILDKEPSWLLGPNIGPYITEKSLSVYARLGKNIAFFGLDCRTERTRHMIVTPETYRAMFKRLRQEVEKSNGEIKQVLLMLGVPFAYPRLVWLERILSSRIMTPIKWVAKHGFLRGLRNEFDGNIEILDDLDDHWCAQGHKKERNMLVEELHKFSKSTNARITVLSGDVHLAGIGRFHSKGGKIAPEHDPHHMLNVISSAIVNTPPPDKVADFLNKRNKIHKFQDYCEEDMVKVFTTFTDGSERNNTRLMPQRNWCSILPITEDIGSSKKPGPRDGPTDNTEFSYPVGPKSLLVTLHMETDPSLGETVPYDVVVPELAVQ